MTRIVAALTALLFAMPCPAADIAALVKPIKAVGPDGAGSAEAAAAWRELSRQNGDAIMPLLNALDRAEPRAANWLRSALDAIVERERKAAKPLPIADLKAFLSDTKHDGKTRRLAFELLTLSDPSTPERMLPTFFDDPSLELRYEAIAKAFDEVKPMPKESAEAKTELTRLLQKSRDIDQMEAITKELDDRGEKVDFIKLYGFITHWHLCSGFDNAAGKGYAAVFPPEVKVDLKSEYKSKAGKDVKWAAHITEDKMGAVDLNKAIGKIKNVVAYGYAVIESPEERDAEVRVASATAVKVVFNGQPVLGRESYHQSFTTDSHIAPIRLRKGKNTILVKVCQNDQKEQWAQDWRYAIRITDSLGTPLPITVDAVKPAKETK